MAGSHSIFQELTGQEHAARVLTAAIEQGRASHAYLFTGPSGTGKMKAALSLAAGLCCAQGGCGVCATCRKAARGTHPDIHLISPVGAFITIDQIRDINRTLNLHPGESRARVYIITDAAAFNAESANAFLKTLEEPPDFAFFLLLAGRADRVLPTVVSRCQEVRFKPIAPAKIEEHLVSNFDVSGTMAQTYARISGGDLALAEVLCDDGELMARRKRYIGIARELARGEAEPYAMAAELLDAAAAAGEAGDIEGEPPEGFESSGRKQREKDAHRRATTARKKELENALAFIQSWFRDLMVMAAGAGEAVINSDYELELEHEALESRVDDYRQAVALVGATRSKLGYNIDLELALLAMFHQLQEVL